MGYEGVGHHALLVHACEKDGPQMSAGSCGEESAFVGYLSSAPLPFRLLNAFRVRLGAVICR